MFQHLYQQLKRIIITLRFSILSIFITLFAVAMISLITVNYLHAMHILLVSSNQLMEKTSSLLFEKIKDEMNHAEKDTQFSANLIQQHLIDSTNIAAMTEYTYQLTSLFDLAEQSYWSNENGTLIDAKYEDNDTVTTELINRDHSPATKFYLIRNTQGNIVQKKNSADLRYDPRKLGWYQSAKLQKKLIWTDVYPYTELPYLGFTIAAPVLKKNGDVAGVFGVDIRLDWFSWYLAQQYVSKHAHLIVLTQSGSVIAYPHLYENQTFTRLLNLTELNQPVIAHAFAIYQKNPIKQFSFHFQGQQYLAVFEKFQKTTSGHVIPWVIGIIAPENDFVYSLKVTTLIDVLVGLIILFLAIWLVSKLVTLIVNPIKRIAAQTEKIKHFDLAEQKPISSRIKEIIMLSDAMQSMRLGLKSFQKYVPASLVRQLIASGQGAQIGGSKKTVAVLFTDIANFTHLTEITEPNLMMEQLCEYLDALTRIIDQEQGTVDKYIGDSIMAFWGAPLDVEHPEYRVAIAALRCKKIVAELNETWRAQQKNNLHTRFGLDIGEAIVGNVGSSERMNFTALGKSINAGNRLEGINKLYGTTILVSEALHKLIEQQFVFRRIDHVVIRGKTQSEFIYELLAENKSELRISLDDYNSLFALGFEAYRQQKWHEAIQLFERCELIWTGDTVSAVFIDRCKKFLLDPPVAWTGIWHPSD